MLLPFQVVGSLPGLLSVATITSFFPNKSLKPKPPQPCPSQLSASQSGPQPPRVPDTLHPLDLDIFSLVSQLPPHLSRSPQDHSFPGITGSYPFLLPATPTSFNRTVRPGHHHPTRALPLTAPAFPLHRWGCPLSPDSNDLNKSVIHNDFKMLYNLIYFILLSYKLCHQNS